MLQAKLGGFFIMGYNYGSNNRYRSTSNSPNPNPNSNTHSHTTNSYHNGYTNRPNTSPQFVPTTASQPKPIPTYSSDNKVHTTNGQSFYPKTYPNPYSKKGYSQTRIIHKRNRATVPLLIACLSLLLLSIAFVVTWLTTDGFGTNKTDTSKPFVRSLLVDGAKTVTVGQKSIYTVELDIVGGDESIEWRSVIWSVDNDDLGTISKNGEFTATAIGEVNITATADGIQSQPFTVVTQEKEIPIVEHITINNPPTRLTVGESHTFTATVYPTDSGIVQWSTIDEDLGTIDSQTGLFTTKNTAGTAYIIASVGDKKDTHKLIIDIPLDSLHISGATTLKVGDISAYTATLYPQNATTVGEILWKVIDSNYGTIDPKTGIFTALQAGTAYLVATIKTATNEEVSNEPAFIVKITDDKPTAPTLPSALRASTVSAGKDKIPEIMGSYTDGKNNYYLLNAGYIINQYVGHMGFVDYNGQTPIKSIATFVTTETYTNSMTETVSDSVMVQKSNGTKVGLKEGVAISGGGDIWGFEVKASIELSQELQSTVSVSSTYNKSMATNTTTMTSFSKEYSQEFTVGNNGEAAGYYRNALYSGAVDVIFVVETNRDNTQLKNWDTYSIASTKTNELIPRFEYSSTPVFDNTPIDTSIDIAEDFYKHLQIPQEKEPEWSVFDRIPNPAQWTEYTRLDFSSANQNGIISIPAKVIKCELIGYKINATIVEMNIQVVLESRTTKLSLTIKDTSIRYTTAIASGLNTTAVSDIDINIIGEVKISSSSNAVPAIHLGGGTIQGTGYLFVYGANGANGITGNQQPDSNGQNGGLGLQTNGELNFEMTGKAYIFGGNGGHGLSNSEKWANRGGAGGHGGTAIRAYGYIMLKNVQVAGGDGGSGGDGHAAGAFTMGGAGGNAGNGGNALERSKGHSVNNASFISGRPGSYGKGASGGLFGGNGPNGSAGTIGKTIVDIV